MLQARRLDGYDDDATVDGAALLHDESEPPLLTSMMHLGRWPLEVARSGAERGGTAQCQ